LWLLFLVAAFPGVWALLWPRSFFDEFPGLGLAWVSFEPPFNQHLVTDVGAFFCAFAVLFAFTATRHDRRMTASVLVAWLVFAVPHLIFHISHWGDRGSDELLSIVVLVVQVLLPLALLTQVGKSERGSGYL
jgi:hypothetical protein